MLIILAKTIWLSVFFNDSWTLYYYMICILISFVYARSCVVDIYCINCPNFSHLPGFTLFSSFSTLTVSLTMRLVLVKTVAHKLDWSRFGEKKKKKLLHFYSVFPLCDCHGESFASLLWWTHGGDQNHPLAATLTQAAPSWLTSWPKTHKTRLIKPGTWQQNHPRDP